MFEHVVIPATFVIAHCPAEDGATAPTGPDTVEVNVIVEPSGAEVAFATTEILGVALPTVVEDPEAGGVAK